MAEAPRGYDFHAVLDATWDDLLDMDLGPVLEELRNSGIFRHRIFRDLQEKYNTTTEKIEALLRLVKDGGYTKYDQMKKCLVDSGQDSLVDIMEAAERGEELKPAKRKKLMTQEEKLQEALINCYLEYESTMPVAPLAEQHDAELTSFYTRPPMMAYKKPNAFGQVKQSTEQHAESTIYTRSPMKAYKKPNAFGQVKQSTEQHAESTIYTRSPKKAYKKPNAFGQVEQSTEQEKTKISSYRELLFGDNGTYRRIYLTADAGMGKTSFSKTLARTWCQAYKPDTIVADKFSKDDLDTMRNFDFLFLIKLREYQGKNICSLDDMIVTMLQSKLPRASSYIKPFVEKVLCNRQCLIIVDGLDEWSHPKHKPSQTLPKEVIPHTTRLPGCCSVLTTTRPWKLSNARLSCKDIDRQVEISELDEATARELESRAVKFLTENQGQNDQVAANTKTKTVTDFENSVPITILGHIRYIPFVLLQIICLWFGNSEVGKSLCEVYSNIIELTLTRWLVKTDSGHTDCECEPSKEHENIKLKCMENNRHCQRYMPLLLKIGKLAFSTLFNVIREESLLFDKKQVLKYLSKEELTQCLDMGLLSQVKDTSSLTKVRLQLYFPHKTLHEYFCALFIVTNWNNATTGTMSIKQTISNSTSVSDILEMSEVFVFVCGLNPEVYSDISRHLATIVSTDQSVIDYRNSVEEYIYSDLLEGYQRMQISCFLESTRNQHPECKIVIEDIIVEDWLYDMEEDEKQAVKSILTSAAHTLKYLRLDGVSLTDDMCSAISTLNNLHALYLVNVDVSSDSVNAVSDCISGCMSLQKLRLHFRYKPSDTDLSDTDLSDTDLSDTDETPEQREASINYLLRSIEAKTMLTYLGLEVDVDHQNCVLDLSKHDKLQELHLLLPVTELHVNTEQLVLWRVYMMYEISAAAVSSLLAELHGAPVLETLTLVGISNPPPRIDITALPLLTEFTLGVCDLRDSTVTLTLPLLTKFTLEECDLRDSTVTLTLPLLTKFTLEECDLTDSTVTLTLPLLTKLNMWCCDLIDSTVTLSPEMTSLETITLEGTTVNIPCYRELFLSISKLPQPITVNLEWIDMTAGEWRELLFVILGKLPKSIHVEMQVCSGPSRRVWRNIVDDMKASPAFRVTRTDLDRFPAVITFDTVVVSGRLLNQIQYI